MERLLEFFQNHPVLCLAFVGLAAATVTTTVQSITRGTRKLSPGEVTRMLNAENAVVVDVRGEGEFRAGHIIDAVNVPHAQVKERAGTMLAKYKERPIILACKAGQQAGASAQALRKAGFENLYQLAGGMLAWQDASMPVTKKAG